MNGLFIVLIVVAVIAIVLLSIYQAEKRRKELSQWALRRGLSFSADQDSSLDSRHPSFECLQKGSGRYAYNMMQGSLQERSICVFDYHYETHSTDSKGHRQTHHHYFSAVILASQVPLKPLAIRGESFFDKIGGFLGFRDIEFESAEFNREFHVSGPDRRWAFDVLNQYAMEFLLESPRFSLEFDDHCAIAYRDKVFSIEDFEAALAVMAGLLDRLPKCVVEEQKGLNR